MICCSGSINLLPGDIPVILYTGIDSKNHLVQNMAVPKDLSDPYLVEWIKSLHNPFILPPNGIHPNDFQDPMAAWKGPDGVWRMVIGAEKDGNGLAVMYSSNDFVKWNLTESPIHSSEKTITWECPDFYLIEENSDQGVETSVQVTLSMI